MPLEQTRAQMIGQALGGFGAGLQGNLPQYQQAQTQQRQQALAEEQQQQKMMQERQKALFFDANASLNMLDNRNFDGMLQLGENRLEMLMQLGAEDPSDTQRVVALMRAAANGSEEAEGLLRAELTSAVEQGRAMGILETPKIPTAATDAGGIQQDFMAGLIDEAQRDSLLAALGEGEEDDISYPGDPSYQAALRVKASGRGVDSEMFDLSDDSVAYINALTPEEAEGELTVARFGRTEEDTEYEFKSSQTKAANYAVRQETSNATLTEFGPQFTGIESRGVEALPQGLRSRERQLFDQATDDFIIAVLRPESGAAINPSEFEDAKRQYIPQPGDNESTLAAKQRSREIVMAASRLEAGPAYEEVKNSLSPKTVIIMGTEYEVGDIIYNSTGGKARVNADGTVTEIQ